MGRLRPVVLVLCLIVLACTRSVDSPYGFGPGVDTIPFYNPGSSAFSTGKAVTRIKNRKDAEQQRDDELGDLIKKRIETSGREVVVIDPWVDPVVRDPAELHAELRILPRDSFGYPDWSAAVRQDLVNPRGTVSQDDVEDEEPAFSDDIIFVINDKLMANVLFSHEEHGKWLSCDNCHSAIFKARKGSNEFNMYDIWSGEACGRCHGKVAFQPKGFNNCRRCHSVSKKGKSTN